MWTPGDTAPRPVAGPERTDRRRNRRHGLALVTAGLAPFVCAGVLSLLGSPGTVDGTCLLREAIGLPCPFCGTTRAFSHAISGDPSLLHYNYFWVMLALGAIGAGAASLFTSVSFRGFWSRRDNLAVFLTVAALLTGWATALANSAWILA